MRQLQRLYELNRCLIHFCKVIFCKSVVMQINAMSELVFLRANMLFGVVLVFMQTILLYCSQ